MFGNSIGIKIKHLVIIAVVLIAYWYVIDKANQPYFEKDVETLLKTNISDEGFFFIKKKHTHADRGFMYGSWCHYEWITGLYKLKYLFVI
jgi:hypothetical protein